MVVVSINTFLTDGLLILYMILIIKSIIGEKESNREVFLFRPIHQKLVQHPILNSYLFELSLTWSVTRWTFVPDNERDQVTSGFTLRLL